MNLIIENQLKKTKICNVPEYDETTTHLFIPKQGTYTYSPVHENSSYIIQFENYILHPSEGFTLHENWNKGVAPTSSIMQVKVLKIMGKMVQISGTGYNMNTKTCTEDQWTGWIPIKSIHILEVL